MQPTRTGKDNNALLSWHLLKSLKSDVTGDDSQWRFFAQRGIGMLEQCCNHLNQCRNNVATLYCPKKSLLRSHGWRVQFLYDNQASYASLFAMKLEPWVIQICLLSLIISNLTAKMNFERLQHSKFLKTMLIHASLCICCVVYTFFLFLCFTKFGDNSHWLHWNTFRDTSPLNHYRNIPKATYILPSMIDQKWHGWFASWRAANMKWSTAFVIHSIRITAVLQQTLCDLPPSW